MVVAGVPVGLLERVRHAELEAVASWFESGQRVLELGAGSGYQASVLEGWGCDVAALEVSRHNREGRSYFPVQEYDGQTIPLPDSSVDRVFTSHVLEHVDPLPPFLEETRRVMKRDAVAIHIVPSATWRIWTSLTHYPFVAKTLIARDSADSLVNVRSAQDAVRRHGVARGIVKAIMHPLAPHGSHRSAAAEVDAFSRRRWAAVLSQNGFAVVDAQPSHIFYTGYGLLTRMPLARRRRMADLLGSSSHAFVVRKEKSR
jgi:SAM-dependent methyltransferase